ncbi:MAG: hypothetical protein B6U72_01055 [Candidatus Altiarchaeales archaeon ex4484_2]|nr:MAG: hypothetical protein B6U72_01055 [Candidatus Altiarchaeales archaeon ex4484_2]
MFFEELIVSANLIEIIAGAIIFYIIPYLLLMLLIDYQKEKKGSVYTYAPVISFITLIIIHVIWAILTATLVNEFMRRMQLTITVLPLCWIISELIRHKKFNKSIIQSLE